ncbi:hypothetical protein OB955_16345 [Halobacteria archaeon AArc-m2/3/4]|uniref:Uncharacterized protein n=2 Tax=Natronoglomus mannanivorans TaxID=2979990 RepID=A0ABT2QH86_9EURY|nr:hypothetical protein [Halobacteria archaeon AArc-m2/3/4]
MGYIPRYCDANDLARRRPSTGHAVADGCPVATILEYRPRVGLAEATGCARRIGGS